MTHVARMTTIQVHHPVTLLVLVKAYDRSLHERLPVLLYQMELSFHTSADTRPGLPPFA